MPAQITAISQLRACTYFLRNLLWDATSGRHNQNKVQVNGFLRISGTTDDREAMDVKARNGRRRHSQNRGRPSHEMPWLRRVVRHARSRPSGEAYPRWGF